MPGVDVECLAIFNSDYVAFPVDGYVLCEIGEIVFGLDPCECSFAMNVRDFILIDGFLYIFTIGGDLFVDGVRFDSQG